MKQLLSLAAAAAVFGVIAVSSAVLLPAKASAVKFTCKVSPTSTDSIPCYGVGTDQIDLRSIKTVYAHYHSALDINNNYSQLPDKVKVFIGNNPLTALLHLGELEVGSNAVVGSVPDDRLALWGITNPVYPYVSIFTTSLPASEVLVVLDVQFYKPVVTVRQFQ